MPGQHRAPAHHHAGSDGAHLLRAPKKCSIKFPPANQVKNRLTLLVGHTRAIGRLKMHTRNRIDRDLTAFQKLPYIRKAIEQPCTQATAAGFFPRKARRFIQQKHLCPGQTKLVPGGSTSGSTAHNNDVVILLHTRLLFHLHGSTGPQRWQRFRARRALQ